MIVMRAILLQPWSSLIDRVGGYLKVQANELDNNRGCSAISPKSTVVNISTLFLNSGDGAVAVGKRTAAIIGDVQYLKIVNS